MSNWLSIISKHHNEWVKIVKGFGEKVYHEDIVQEMYLRIYKFKQPEDIIHNNQVNKGYIFLTLRNLYLTSCTEKSKVKKVSIDDYEQCDKYNDELMFLTYDEILNNIEKEVEEWNWYDKKMFYIYHNENKSIRTLSKEMGISKDSIHNTLKKCHAKVREKVGEDYTDYLNKDYEFIKNN